MTDRDPLPRPASRREPVRFDPVAALPAPGITVIEASAGTGKTFALTGLAVRYVADGMDMSSIMAVTFTRLATGELRDRIRGRLLDAQAALGAVLAGGAPPADDALLDFLAGGPARDVERRWERISDALADFDAATITTTHGFCQLVLDGLGVSGDTIAGTTLLEDPSDLVAEVVDDLYLRWSIAHPRLEFGPEVARRATMAAVANPGTRLEPPGGRSASGLLSRLAARARDEVERRLLDEGLVTYDQLLHRLAGTLDDPVRGARACHRLSDRYRVVLVDEFQDTDPVQWRILRLAFTGEGSSLILIGDPKQAIYAFRGADVYAYLDAAGQAAGHYTLEESWRADQPLLDAVDALLRPLELGHRDIPFRSVSAAPGRDGNGLQGGEEAPLRFRLVDDRQPGIPLTPAKGLLQKPALVEWIAGDVAADVAALFASGATISAAGGSGRRAVVPGDVGVLTRTNRQALAVRDALRRAGIGSVVAGLDSVFGSEAATGWLRLLDALLEPASRAAVAAVALSPFGGMTAAQVAAASESDWEDLHDRVRGWSAVLARDGVAALYRAATREEGLPGRVLAVAGGERLLTDLGHVAHLLHAAAAAGSLGPAGLRAWLAARVRSAGEEQSDMEERSRRLDSDAAAVQILTIHRAKGLEFPVVYCPYLWDGGNFDSGSGPVVFHDPDDAMSRVLDVGCPQKSDPGRLRYERSAGLARAERRGEELRLLYVALTRARHRLVVWWGRSKDSRLSPLARLLLCRHPQTGAVGEPGAGEPRGAQIRGALEQVVARCPGLVGIEAAGAWSPARAVIPPADHASGHLSVSHLERALDLRWGRCSYTSITAGAHGAGGVPGQAVGSEPEETGITDEPADAPAPGDPAAAGEGGEELSGAPGPGEPRSPWAAIAGGAETGTWIHSVMERTDFAAADPAAAVAAALSSVATPAGGAEPAMVVDALLPVLETPLGPLLQGRSLSAIGRSDRLDELAFELPVAGGDQPVGDVQVADIAALLRRYHRVGDPLAGYADRLGDPLLVPAVRGYLTGSLDLVFRVRGAGGEPRWYVADYKTNWLAPAGRQPSVWDYRPGRLDAEMQRRHYPLQAMIYLTALHRYLRWRQAGYRPEIHLGGVLYLFLRGMAGAAAPVEGGHPCGVLSWAPDVRLVTGLSDLLEGTGAQR